ncbi:MAG: 2-hydroxy-3-oxopropionate reductase [Chloroflexi bacterium]|nr:2-hydroxy-3-oxopropionate reductase [Chloroflexota bacterium]
MQQIGFVGLGTMGKPMARNLIKAGYELVVLTRTRAKAEDVLNEGAIWADTPGAVAAQCDAVITMLPDSPDVARVVRDLFERARPGSLVIDMSTISPIIARELARECESRQLDWLDAPVSGGEVGAINATLSIMVGGTTAAFNRALPIFQAMGKNIVHIGDAGAGQITKAANQIVVALTIEAISEALVLASKAGVDPAKVRQALLGGFAQSRILDLHGQRMLDHNFKPGFRANLHRKDLGIALATGREYGVPLPVTAQVNEMFNALIAAEQGDADHSSIVTLIEAMARKTL